MAEWRDILDRAADNLSVDLNRSPQAPFRQQPAGWPAPRPGPRQAPFAATRDLLASELEAISSPSPAQRSPQTARTQTRARAPQSPAPAVRAPITQAIAQPAQAQQEPAQEPAAAKSCTGRELAALSISVGIVVLAVYGFFVLLR